MAGGIDARRLGPLGNQQARRQLDQRGSFDRQLADDDQPVGLDEAVERGPHAETDPVEAHRADELFARGAEHRARLVGYVAAGDERVEEIQFLIR